MATERPQSDRFEDIDWDSVSSGFRFGIPPRSLGMLLSALGIVALFAYDRYVLSSDTATFEQLGWGYNVTQIDWLFMFALLFIFFYIVVPLYQNPRMTRYYWDNFKKNRPALLSLVYLLAIFAIGMVGPLFISKPELALFDQYQPPVYTSVSASYPIECAGEVANGACHGTWEHPMGTDGDGRSILKIVIFGMTLSMKLGFIIAMIVVVIGSVVGTVAAYAGSLVDEILMRYVDIQQVFPAFLLYLLIIYIYSQDIIFFILVYGFLSWGGTARYVRSNALQKTEEEYIKAAKASGASTWHVIRRHLVPNTASSIITQTTLLIPGVILAEAGFSFLGLGDPSIPSWGQAIAAGRDDLDFAWWIATIPGVFLFFTILAFNFLGDALLDAINPQAEAENE